MFILLIVAWWNHWKSLKVTAFRDAAMGMIELSHWQPSRRTVNALEPQSKAKNPSGGRTAFSLLQLYHMLSLHLSDIRTFCLYTQLPVAQSLNNR